VTTSGTPTPADRTGAAFRRAVESGDVAAAVALLADDVEFSSPIVHRLYRGRDAVAPVLYAVTTVFEDFRYTAEYSSADGHVLRFSARVDDRDLDGVDILTVDAEGRIVAFAVMVRPYSAATALRSRMAALLTGPS
jgi:ketosteroid isomerase-like protein